MCDARRVTTLALRPVALRQGKGPLCHRHGKQRGNPTWQNTVPPLQFGMIGAALVARHGVMCSCFNIVVYFLALPDKSLIYPGAFPVGIIANHSPVKDVRFVVIFVLIG